MCSHCHSATGCIHCREEMAERRRENFTRRTSKTFEQRILLGLIAGPMWSAFHHGPATRNRLFAAKRISSVPHRTFGTSVLPASFAI